MAADIFSHTYARSNTATGSGYKAHIASIQDTFAGLGRRTEGGGISPIMSNYIPSGLSDDFAAGAISADDLAYDGRANTGSGNQATAGAAYSASSMEGRSPESNLQMAASSFPGSFAPQTQAHGAFAPIGAPFSGGNSNNPDTYRIYHRSQMMPAEASIYPYSHPQVMLRHGLDTGQPYAQPSPPSMAQSLQTYNSPHHMSSSETLSRGIAPQPRQSPDDPLRPTWEGYIGTVYDALLILEAVLCGRLHHTNRRAQDKERAACIRSGAIFVYQSNASGVQRWTDGSSWSPSRGMNSFLIYREMKDGIPSSEKKKTTSSKSGRSRKRKSPDAPIRRGSQETAEDRYRKRRASAEAKLRPGVEQRDVMMSRENSQDSSPLGEGLEEITDTNEWRAICGALIDSYPFKPNGLMKKTISIKYEGIEHHIISYYNPHDVKRGKLVTPSKTVQGDLFPGVRRDLLLCSFRGTIDGLEALGAKPVYDMTTHHPNTGSMPSLAPPDVPISPPALEQSMSAPPAQSLPMSAVPFLRMPHGQDPGLDGRGMGF